MAWIELFTTDIGLLSLFTILFIVAMAVYIVVFVKRQAADEMKLGAGGNQLPHAH